MSSREAAVPAADLETRSVSRATGRTARAAWAFLSLLALATPVSAAKAERFDWKRCAVEVMPASARALVAAQQSLIDGNGFTPDYHDSHKKLELACGYEIRRRTGKDPGYFRPRVLYRYLKRHIDELVGDDQIEPSFILFQLLDPATSPPTFMGHRTYLYMDDVLVRVEDHASTTCWVGRDLLINQFTGNEVEHLQQIWPSESLDANFNASGATLSDAERAQIFPRPVCEQNTRAKRGGED